jgi:hypothetical protein
LFKKKKTKNPSQKKELEVEALSSNPNTTHTKKIPKKWKCHKETPCVAILNKEKCHFFLLQNQRTGG